MLIKRYLVQNKIIMSPLNYWNCVFVKTGDQIQFYHTSLFISKVECRMDISKIDFKWEKMGHNILVWNLRCLNNVNY